jgi:superfamily II DNA or RNA helicase/HKD family nuclease
LDLTESIQHGLNTGFIDGTAVSVPEYQPNLILNDSKRGVKFLTTLTAELQHCEEFFFCVAFITNSGVQTLIRVLEDLQQKGIRGRIIASQYQNFTEPLALKRLASFSNIELRIITEGNLHSKGYIFRTGDFYSLIVGSSNLTQDALTRNNEWNLRVTSLHSGAIVHRTLEEFERNFAQAVEINDEWIDQYSQIYLRNKRSHAMSPGDEVDKDELSEDVFQQAILHIGEIKPNRMQAEALQSLQNLRSEGKNKALLISATGTGKTYLSAFDARKVQPRRLLFIIHRENIARAAMASFRKVFYDTTKRFGILSGTSRDIESDFLFTTIQTLSKDEVLHQFGRDHFDYIILDEAHHGEAMTYQKVLDYFQPKFLLGMTATPERSSIAKNQDNKEYIDLFKRFDYNIAYEIRLHKALEEDMLCPFHYFGVTDVFVDDTALEEGRAFLRLTTDERVKHILERSEFYGCDDGNIRCLVFCSRNDVSEELAKKFQALGKRAISLSGSDGIEVRERAIQALESDDPEEKLDYIFSVDIFNEGVDIPRVNQIILLRPTQSAIVFVQQLGRGLRKRADKDYLTVIDFIGNYTNNYLVPIALYGDSTYNKDRLRRLMVSGNAYVPGASTIHFDAVAQQRIFDSINASNLSLLQNLKKDYELLKYKIGRIPTMTDFVEHGSRDPKCYVDYKDAQGSLYGFVCKMEKDFKDSLNVKEKKILKFTGSDLANGKRIEEVLLMQLLLEKGKISVTTLEDNLRKAYGIPLTEKHLASVITNTNLRFVQENQGGRLVPVGEAHDITLVTHRDGDIALSEEFMVSLTNPVFAEYFKDLLHYGKYAFDAEYDPRTCQDGFILYKKYSRKDVFRILCWEQNPVAQNVGGYILSRDRSNCPIFVTYHKAEGISESIRYEDQFLSTSHFQWMSKSKRTMSSPEIQAILNDQGNLRLPLFIQKSNDEGTEFYYMGDTIPMKERFRPERIPLDASGTRTASIVHMELQLKVPVERGLYAYLLGEM